MVKTVDRQTKYLGKVNQNMQKRGVWGVYPTQLFQV